MGDESEAKLTRNSLEEQEKRIPVDAEVNRLRYGVRFLGRERERSGDELLKKPIENSSWQKFQFDLTKHAGEKIRIELENRASDWAFEAAYWSRIELD